MGEGRSVIPAARLDQGEHPPREGVAKCQGNSSLFVVRWYCAGVRLLAVLLLASALPSFARAEGPVGYVIAGGTAEARQAADERARAFLAKRGVAAQELGATQPV